MDRIRGLWIVIAPLGLALLTVPLFVAFKGRVSKDAEFGLMLLVVFTTVPTFILAITVLMLNSPGWRRRRGLFAEAARKHNAVSSGGFFRPLVFEAEHRRGTLRVRMGSHGEAGAGRQVVAVDSTWIALQGRHSTLVEWEGRSDGALKPGPLRTAALRMAAFSRDGVARIESGEDSVEVRLVGYLTDRKAFEEDLDAAIRAIEELYVALGGSA